MRNATGGARSPHLGEPEFHAFMSHDTQWSNTGAASCQLYLRLPASKRPLTVAVRSAYVRLLSRQGVLAYIPCEWPLRSRHKFAPTLVRYVGMSLMVGGEVGGPGWKLS
eukprot:5282328-Amphidinium_carterae.1